MRRFYFAVIPDIHLGREKVNINFWDRAPEEEATTGIGIEKRLRRIVREINENQEIKFTILIGDITETALPEQFEKVTEILQKLKNPYIPLLGNHDIWPYRRDEKDYKRVVWEAHRPLSVLKFEEYFGDILTVPWLSKQRKSLQNYSFTFREMKFIVIDNVNRRHALFGLPGTVPWSKLHRESKDWLEREIVFAGKRGIIILSHTPIKTRYLERLLRQSQKARTILNVAGHKHKRTIRVKKDTQVITTNSLYLEPQWLKVSISYAPVQFRYQYQSIST